MQSLFNIDNFNKKSEFNITTNYYNDLKRFTLICAAKSGTHVYENFINKYANLKSNRETHTYTIQEIFKNHWEEFLVIAKNEKIPVREAIHTEVDKLIGCKDLTKGYLYFECPDCDNYHIQGLSCHSRFCPSCGKKYRDARAVEASTKCIDVNHRHITFTIDKRLRKYIKLFEAYDILFHSVDDVLKYLVTGVPAYVSKYIKSKKRIKKTSTALKEGRTLGYMLFLHTFGRDLKYNPHIHALVAERIYDNEGNKKRYDYFPYEQMRKSFMKQIIYRINDLLVDQLIKGNISRKYFNDFKTLVSTMYKENKKGFYVHAPKRQGKSKRATKSLIDYVLRYASHPAMSESRIIKYDKENKTIEYFYDPHEDDGCEVPEDQLGRQFVKESVFTFIGKLIRHIPNKGVHVSRYYGYYANKSKIDVSNEPKVYSQTEIKMRKNDLKWNVRLKRVYGYDKLLCHCGATMILNYELSSLEKLNGG